MNPYIFEYHLLSIFTVSMLCTFFFLQKQQNPDFLSPLPSLILGMFQLVNAMGTLTHVTLIWTHGWHQGTKVGAFVTTVNIILKDNTVNVASQAFIEILESIFLLLTPANVSQS